MQRPRYSPSITFCHSFRQRTPVELAALGLRQRDAEHDLLRRLECRQPLAAIAQELAGIDRGARARHHVAHHFLAVDRVRHADGGDLDQLGVLHQEAVDLDRRNVHAAANDEVLLAAGEAEKTVGIETAPGRRCGCGRGCRSSRCRRRRDNGNRAMHRRRFRPGRSGRAAAVGRRHRRPRGSDRRMADRPCRGAVARREWPQSSRSRWIHSPARSECRTAPRTGAILRSSAAPSSR